MKKFTLLFLFIFFIISFINSAVCLPDGNQYFDKPQEYKYPNGKIKERANWNNGLIMGTRELYDQNGNLLEEHVFKAGDIQFTDGKPTRGIGIIRTYYKNGAVASEIPASQELFPERDKFTYKIRIFDTIKGYYEDKKLAYKAYIEKPFLLNDSRSDFYTKYNMFFYDVILLYNDQIIRSFNFDITFFHPNGKVAAKGKMINCRKSGKWQNFYESGNLQSEGEYLLDNSTMKTVPVGYWKYYSENNLPIKEEEYFKGGPHSYLKQGDKINIAKYYFENGKIHFIINYPGIADNYVYTDTIEEYYNNGNLKYKYDATKQVPQYTGTPYKYSGKVESFYPNGERKELGFLGKIPRQKVPDDELAVNSCIMDNNFKKIGYWYFFDENGTITKIVEYNLCGEVKKIISDSEVSKINIKYQLSKANYDFDFIIRF